MSRRVGGPPNAQAARSIEPHELTRREWGATSGKEDAGEWTHPNLIDWEVAVPSSYYEIRVTGVMPPEALLDFDRLVASVEPVETVVHGPLRDQAHLNGFLARLETFGVQVLEMRRLQDRDLPGAERDLRG
jgi:hypothetical protein